MGLLGELVSMDQQFDQARVMIRAMRLAMADAFQMRIDEGLDGEVKQPPSLIGHSLYSQSWRPAASKYERSKKTLILHQTPRCARMIGSNFSHRSERLLTAEIAVGIQDTNAFSVTFERSSGFFVASSAIVDRA